MFNEEWKNLNEQLADSAGVPQDGDISPPEPGHPASDPRLAEPLRAKLGPVGELLQKHPDLAGRRLSFDQKPAEHFPNLKQDAEFGDAQRLGNISRGIGAIGNAFQQVTERPQPLGDYAQRLAGTNPTPIKHNTGFDQVEANADQPVQQLMQRRQMDMEAQKQDPNSAVSKLSQTFLSKYGLGDMTAGKSHAQLEQIFPFIKELVPPTIASDAREEVAKTAATAKEAGAKGMRDLIWSDPANTDFLKAQGVTSRADLDKMPDEALRAMQTDYTARRASGVKDSQEQAREGRQEDRDKRMKLFEDELIRARAEAEHARPKDLTPDEGKQFDEMLNAKDALARAKLLYYSGGGGSDFGGLRAKVGQWPTWAQNFVPSSEQEKNAQAAQYEAHRIKVLDPIIRNLSGLGVRVSALDIYNGQLPDISTPEPTARKVFEDADQQLSSQMNNFRQGLRAANKRVPGETPPIPETAPKKPNGPVNMKFPDGSVHPVDPDKVEKARRKGGIEVP